MRSTRSDRFSIRSPGSPTRTVAAVALATVLVGAACAGPGENPDRGVIAEAMIQGCGDSEVSGLAVFRERPSAEGVKIVDLSLRVDGLPDGLHAVHVHETAACDPCSAAGGHHDPGPFGKTTPDAPDFNHPFHGGDLVNVEVKDGVGSLTTATSRFTLSDGRLSVFDDDGSALIIHTNPDAYCDQEDELAAGCAGGGRGACGVLVLAE
ncbi:MAG: superoxide dismutase family protein [Gemmatimonadetes bacterium]|nr:superoxide dismutase family protein [Gemmatimonadota bacterium]